MAKLTTSTQQEARTFERLFNQIRKAITGGNEAQRNSRPCAIHGSASICLAPQISTVSSLLLQTCVNGSA